MGMAAVLIVLIPPVRRCFAVEVYTDGTLRAICLVALRQAARHGRERFHPELQNESCGIRSVCEIAEITGVYKRRVTGMERSGCLLPDVNQFHLADESQKQKNPGGSTGLWLETLGIAAITVSKASQGERIRIFNESTLYFKTTF